MQRADLQRDPAGVSLFDTALWTLAALLALIALILGIDWVVRADTFPVRAVRFEGEFQHVTQAELETAVLESVRASFLRVDLEAVKAKVERVPWVQSASVRRGWPRDVYVQFTEQQLLARWNGDGFVNQAMQAVRVPGAAAAPEAPELEGPEGTAWQVFERHQVLDTLLAPAGLKLKRLTLTPRRTWRLELGNGLLLVLDRDDIEHKVERFAQSWPALRREGAREARAIQQVDLRYSNGFAVQWKLGRYDGTTGGG
jgi:cell division protein FtsQ